MSARPLPLCLGPTQVVHRSIIPTRVPMAENFVTQLSSTASISSSLFHRPISIPMSSMEAPERITRISKEQQLTLTLEGVEGDGDGGLNRCGGGVGGTVGVLSDVIKCDTGRPRPSPRFLVSSIQAPVLHVAH